MLDLKVINPYNYRKGLGYFLRTQSDYDDEFRVSKFGRGKDKDWKPFMALLLGLDEETVAKKYEVDQKIEADKEFIERLEDEAGSNSAKYDEIRGLIEIREVAAGRIKKDLSEFSFRSLEAEINEEAVYEIEQQVAQLNKERYEVDYETEEINRSLKTNFDFDIAKIKSIFEEVQVSFPNSLEKEYNDLIEFNRRISSERGTRLRSLLEKLNNRRVEIDIRLANLDRARQQALEILRGKETLAKFNLLQRKLIQIEEEILGLKQNLAQLDRVAIIQKQIEERQIKRTEMINLLQSSLRSENAIYSSIRRTFSDYIEYVLSAQALLSVTVNQNGNLDFKTRILDKSVKGRETSESDGTSYKKLLCACLDLSLLSAYSTEPFYHFVYHDGIFEGLDNRKKVRLLELIRTICREKNIQYILTVIDSDLPRNELDQKLLFSQDEIVRELSDEGAKGRLFRMAAF